MFYRDNVNTVCTVELYMHILYNLIFIGLYYIEIKNSKMFLKLLITHRLTQIILT